MGLAVTILIALVAGGLWALVLRRLRRGRRVIGAPGDVSKVLRAYTAGRWDTVIADAPGCLDRHTSDDAPWRAALELALGHALVQRDRSAEAVGHLEIGLARQAAHSSAEGTGSASSEAKMRHMLGYALTTTGRIDEAREQYERALALPGIDQAVRGRVTAALAELDTAG